MSQFSKSGSRVLGLIIDTSSVKAAVGLVSDNEILRLEKWENGPGVGKVLLERIDELLEEEAVGWEDVVRIGVVVIAERKHSSLRAGVTVANMLGFSKGIEVVELEAVEEAEMLRELWESEAVATALVRYG